MRDKACRMQRRQTVVAARTRVRGWHHQRGGRRRACTTPLHTRTSTHLLAVVVAVEAAEAVSRWCRWSPRGHCRSRRRHRKKPATPGAVVARARPRRGGGHRRAPSLKSGACRRRLRSCRCCRSLHVPLEQLSLPSDDSSRGSGVRPRGGMEEPTRQAPLESDDRRALQARKHEAHTRNMRGSTGLRGPWVGAGAGGRGCARQCDTQELRNSLYRNCRVSQQPRTHACAVCADRRVHSTHLDAGVHAPIGPRLAHWRTPAMPGDGGRLAPARSAATPHLTLLAGPKAASRTDMAHSPRG